MTEAYPLQWPANKRRTQRRERSRFDITFAAARDALIPEIRRLGGTHIVLSTNISLRQDGLPYANRGEPDDRGAATYFRYGDKSMCFACDKWDKVGDNIHAIRKTIEAIRGIERWGSKDMLEAAFTGFIALPPPGKPWHEVLGVVPNAPMDVRRRAYLLQAKIHHPDSVGGDEEKMAEVNRAWEEAQNV